MKTAHKRFFVSLLLAVGATLFSIGVWAQDPSRRAILVLTNVFNGLENVREFTCRDTLYGYITLPQKAVGAHLLEGFWTMPDGTVREHAKIPLNFPSPGRRTAQIWLSFQEKASNALSDFGARSDGNEETDPHEGEWRVNVLWDGQPLIEKTFKVHCS